MTKEWQKKSPENEVRADKGKHIKFALEPEGPTPRRRQLWDAMEGPKTKLTITETSQSWLPLEEELGRNPHVPEPEPRTVAVAALTDQLPIPPNPCPCKPTPEATEKEGMRT